MSLTALTEQQRLDEIRSSVPARSLVAAMEGLCDTFGDYIDIRREPARLFDADVSGIAIDRVMEGVDSYIDGIEYEPNAAITMESYDDNNLLQGGAVMSMNEAHRTNLRQLMENSMVATRQAHPNQRNMNELTPFDAFLPFAIVRSYLPLVMNQIVPYVVPQKDFIRLKWSYKYIVTKDNQTYLRPDVYSDPEAVEAILASAKGKRVTDLWYPLGEAASEGDENTYEEEGTTRKVPTDRMAISKLDLLAQSGGITSMGDQLDRDICVYGARGMVTNSAGETKIVEAFEINAFPDLTSITPQRSVSFTVRYPILDADGKMEGEVEDNIYGSYNDSSWTFNLVSETGVTKQVQFNGHLSNKNNNEYIQYTSDFRVEQHPIPEGFRFNAPITPEDMHLYNQTSSMDIVANAVNEATEMFTELEDTSVLGVLNKQRNIWKDAGTNHPYIHFQKGPVVITREVSVDYTTSGGLLKRNEYIQDTIAYALDRLVDDVQKTTQNEPYKIILFAHPTVASLFVGDNVSWKIQPGTAISEGIRTDFNMGIYTSAGHTLRLVTSLKFQAEDGVRFIVLPVNEENFLTWKHFKFSLYFDRDHRIRGMETVPDIMCISRFYTHPYIPMQGALLIKDYDV